MDGFTNVQAAQALGVGPTTVGRLSHTFRLVNEKDYLGRIIWRGDVIRRAAKVKAEIVRQGQRMSVERLIEQAIREVEG